VLVAHDVESTRVLPQVRVSEPCSLTRLPAKVPAADSPPLRAGSVVRARTAEAPGAIVARSSVVVPAWVVSVQPRRTAGSGPGLSSSTHSPSASVTSTGSGITSATRTCVGTGGGGSSVGVGARVGVVVAEGVGAPVGVEARTVGSGTTVSAST
jgi:hypothetical protein